MQAAESEVLHHFDTRRRDFAPYGFTCEIWEPRQMLRPDRHDEIEINFVDRGSLTYLIGGQRVTVHARRVSAFWAAVPHQVVAFDNVNYYYVVTVPFGWVLQWGLPEQLMLALTQGHLIADVDLDRAAEPKVSTRIGFLDHMLEQLGKHGEFALELTCNGDTHIDEHHTVEDSALACAPGTDVLLLQFDAEGKATAVRSPAWCASRK